MQKWAIGVDLGGTKIEVAIIRNDGKLIDRLRIPTDRSGGPDHIISSIADVIKKLMTQNPNVNPTIIGVGVAGQIDNKSGKVLYAPNLNWTDVDLQDLLADKLHIPVVVCNDVKAAAWGEWKYGAGIDCNNMLCIFVGTGIGGAIISNGQVLDGCNNTAGEIGHMILQLHGPVCHCGNEGCFEALAGGWAITRDAQQAVKQNEKDGAILLSLANGDITAIDGKTVTDAAQKGDPLALKLIDNIADVLTAGVTSAINLLGPCKVILGGGVIEGMPELVAMIEKKISNMALKAAIKSVAISPAQLHNDAGVTGAAAYALYKNQITTILP